MSISNTPDTGAVPNPLVLLSIQVAGGVLALLPIFALRRFATVPDQLYVALVAGGVLNVLISGGLLTGFLLDANLLDKVTRKVGEIGICRALILYDILMLGVLVYLTGGAEKSAFAPQFAAVLPMAVLIRDVPAAKWVYATVFLLMFLLGLQPYDGYTESATANGATKTLWFVIFFFIFTLFPVVYSLQTERSAPTKSGP